VPTYEYRCPKGHEFEKFQKMSQSPRTRCPTCGRMAARRISAGAGLVFRGSGFYITDYGKDGKGPRKSEEAVGSDPASKDTPKEPPKEPSQAKAAGKRGKKKAAE
jgi:putative FmdB family regulatory protein